MVDFREKLLQCLGGHWPDASPLDARVLHVEYKDGYRLESVRYRPEADDDVPAFLMIPDRIDERRRAPAVAVWHQHNGAYHLGKVEPAGLAGDAAQQVGVALAKEGYVVLCPDALCFGERQSPFLKGGDFERFAFLKYLVAGKCLAWKNILDMRRSVDYLCSRKEVDKDRIGCFGHSMGSTHTWLVGPWEPRLRCLVGNCCLPTYAAIHRTHLLHCFPNFIPGLNQYGDTPDIAALIAPRPLLLNFGENDAGSPIAEVRQGLKTIERAYQAVHAEENFACYIEQGGGHALSPEMWRRTRDWLAKHLKV